MKRCITNKLERYNGDLQEMLIGEYLTADGEKKETIGSIDHLSLSEVWVEGLIESGLTAKDISVYLFSAAGRELGSYARTPKQVVQFLYTMSLFPGETLYMFEDLSVIGLGAAFEEGILSDHHIRRLVSSEHFPHLLTKSSDVLDDLKSFSRYEEFIAIIDEVL